MLRQLCIEIDGLRHWLPLDRTRPLEPCEFVAESEDWAK